MNNNNLKKIKYYLNKYPKIKFLRHIFFLIIYKFFFKILHSISFILAKLLSFINFLLMRIDWYKYPPTEWMDHDQDTYYQFNSIGSFHHFERGIISRLYLDNLLISKIKDNDLNLKKKINILDLCSGDSYISQKFFFDVSETIVSLDLDPQALKRGQNRIAKNKYMNKNHFFFEFDIEKTKIFDFLKKKNLNINFDIILFNAAIEHFKENQLDFIFSSLKEVMSEKSYISIYTIIDNQLDNNYLPDHHEMFFYSKKHLENILSNYFKFTKAHNFQHNDRNNIYCIASDQKIEI
jgi:hypothetical protein